MKTFTIYGLTAVLLLGLTVSVSAQNSNPARSPETQQALLRNGMKRMMYSIWNGEGSNLMMLGFLEQNDFREAIGVSNEQNQKIQEVISGMEIAWQNDPNTTLDKVLNFVNENLTSDQMKKFKELQISMMSEFPIVSPNMFEVLNLSNEQKEQLDRIKKEMEPEFERWADEKVDSQLKYGEILRDALEGKLEGITDPKEQEKILGEVRENVLNSNPELRRTNNELRGSREELANRLKVEMFDVLTDEQWDRMLELIDNPPDYVKRVIAQRRVQHEQQEKARAYQELIWTLFILYPACLK